MVLVRVCICYNWSTDDVICFLLPCAWWCFFLWFALLIAGLVIFDVEAALFICSQLPFCFPDVLVSSFVTFDHCPPDPCCSNWLRFVPFVCSVHYVHYHAGKVNTYILMIYNAICGSV